MAESTDAPEDAPEDPNVLNLEAREYGKLGVVHCGVTRDGMVSVGGRQAELEDGGEHVDDYAGIAVRRAGERYTFTKAA